MKILLAALDVTLIDAWQSHCADLDSVEVHRGSILEAECDAVVSPSNSFGFMDGGIDMVYSRHFGWHVQERLQASIRELHHGELVVGSAEIIETDHESIPYLIAAPTMRVPMILSETVNPFLAARGSLLLVKGGKFRSGPSKGKPISEAVKTLAFPGLGTGVGRVPPRICAQQVRAAIEEVVLGEHTFPRTWADAQVRHQGLYGGAVRDLQIDPPG